MTVEVHVTGTVEVGRFAELLEAARQWQASRGARGWAALPVPGAGG